MGELQTPLLIFFEDQVGMLRPMKTFSQRCCLIKFSRPVLFYPLMGPSISRWCLSLWGVGVEWILEWGLR